jgi:hypothetical protein
VRTPSIVFDLDKAFWTGFACTCHVLQRLLEFACSATFLTGCMCRSITQATPLVRAHRTLQIGTIGHESTVLAASTPTKVAHLLARLFAQQLVEAIQLLSTAQTQDRIEQELRIELLVATDKHALGTGSTTVGHQRIGPVGQARTTTVVAALGADHQQCVLEADRAIVLHVVRYKEQAATNIGGELRWPDTQVVATDAHIGKLLVLLLLLLLLLQEACEKIVVVGLARDMQSSLASNISEALIEIGTLLDHAVQQIHHVRHVVQCQKADRRVAVAIERVGVGLVLEECLDQRR